LKIFNTNRADRMAQVVEQLPSKSETQSSNPQYRKKKNKETPRDCVEQLRELIRLISNKHTDGAVSLPTYQAVFSG
jgi:hypothetical protein